MKRIIAAALSVLVGAFGYTIVDQAVEDRVTSLESEVVELREEVSRYHPQYGEQVTTSPASESTTRNKVTTTYNPTTGDFVDPSQPLVIGSYLKESSSSLHKFLIREYTNGTFRYISHNNFEPVTFMTRPIITTQPEETQSKTVVFSNGYIIYDGNTNDDPVDIFITTSVMPPVAEYYINITESSAQITDITEEVSYKYGYDKDYSSVSEPISETVTQITVLCKGYTDPALAGKKVIFTVNNGYYGSYVPKEIISNTINSDGSFEYKAVHSTTASVRGIDEYSFTSIKIA